MDKLFKELGAKYPIIQGGMTLVAEHNLVSAASNSGILGVLGTGHKTTNEVELEIEKTKSLTKKSFGLNLMVDSKNIEELVDVVIDNKVDFVTLGNGNASNYIERFKKSGVKVLPIAPSVLVAKYYEKLGADAIIVEGNEAGGHIGRNSTITILPQVSKAINIPVIAAGGIANGHIMASAFCMGASGVQIGTLFVASKESTVSFEYKNEIIKSNDTSTVITGDEIGTPVRGIKNNFTKKIKKTEKMFVKGKKNRDEVSILTKDSLKNAYEGDTEWGSVMAGSNSGLVTSILPINEQIENICREFNDTVYKLRGLRL